ncbi:hypothetical protein [Roseovarius sp. SYSU LYC5161]|uniref:hypothetical protein n=1 Tax=Roseovarius halophilus (ex Wu et al. 2025) TaxID=3376060 RepID=UPI0028727676|nr:hypothetical protein [Roseovarius sp.]
MAIDCEKLAKLLSKLDASATDAERLAVLGRLDRELASAGTGWPDLAKRLVQTAQPSAQPSAGGTIFDDPRTAAR